LKLLVLVAAVTALGAVAGAVYVGSRVREDTVVAQPFEEGLRHDSERDARAALGWTVAVAPGPLQRTGPIELELRDRAGAPLAGAAVTLTVTRAESGHGAWTAEARDLGGGRYAADAAFPEGGGWELRLDVRRGGARARLSQPVTVAAAPAPGGACDLGGGACTLDVGGGTAVRLELGPRPLGTMADLVVDARVSVAGAPLEGAQVTVAFEMAGMPMGPNRSALAPAGAGRYTGAAVLVRCPSGRRDWIARVTVVPAGGAPRTGAVALTVTE
jgi:nitrogen fixation protein FixH